MPCISFLYANTRKWEIWSLRDITLRAARFQRQQQNRILLVLLVSMDTGSSEWLAMQKLQNSWNQDYCQSGSFHSAIQTKVGLPPAVRMLYWLLPSPQKQKSNRQAKKGGRFFGVAGGNWGKPGASQQHRQPPLADPQSPDSTDPMISAFFNVTYTSSSTVRTLDRRTSWAPRKNSIKASAPPLEEPTSPSNHPFGSGWHHLQQSHTGARSWFPKN